MSDSVKENLSNISAAVLPLRIVHGQELEASFFVRRRFTNRTEIVGEILQNIREHGDSAVREYAARFDRANPASFLIPAAETEEAVKLLRKEESELYEALCLSRDSALCFAQKQRESFTDFEIEISEGLITGQKNIPVERAGVYVPAGRFPLLSSVIMGVIPAKAAGVSEIILCTPPQARERESEFPYVNQRILAAAGICGIDRVFAVGGAQAIAAMAYGTETIPQVDVLVGPGNRFVAEAKRMVYGEVGIDMIAGPTEVLIIADKTAHPEWLAADMLAQAEHDTDAQAVLVTTSEDIAMRTAEELKKQLAELPTRETAAASLSNYGYIIIVNTFEEAAAIANKKAPEHLEIAMGTGAAMTYTINTVRNYGSLFIGHGTAEVLGDYAAGLNHTLPTSGSARFTGGLSVRHFLKTVTTLRQTGNGGGYYASLKAANIIGKAEGLEGHAKAARLRYGKEE